LDLNNARGITKQFAINTGFRESIIQMQKSQASHVLEVRGACISRLVLAEEEDWKFPIVSFPRESVVGVHMESVGVHVGLTRSVI